jgi:hypothetical protein
MNRAGMLLLVALAGCTNEEAFREDADAATCAWLEECFDDDAQQCLQEADAAWSGVDEDCEFDKGKARKCVRQLERLDCPSDAGGGAMPESCDEVWTCP